LWAVKAYIEPSTVDYDIVVKITAQRDQGMVVSRGLGFVSKVEVNTAKLLSAEVVDASTLTASEAQLLLAR